MLEHIDIKKLLFLDIETVPQYSSFSQMPDKFKKLWEHKAQFIQREEELSPEEKYHRAGIYAEFGKIVCISVGYMANDKLRIKSFYSDNEKQLLTDFCQLLEQHFSTLPTYLCAHNGKEFDFPYIARRILINALPLPALLDSSGKKPWEVTHLDTMELWKFGDFKSFTSLELLAAVFDIPTPKDDISGADVGRVYWENHDLEKIKNYCQKDVVTIVNLFRKFKGLDIILIEEAVFIE